MTAMAVTADALARAQVQLPRDALSGMRRDALARFAARGFPTMREESWKYTDLAPVAEISRRWLEHGASRVTPDDWQAQLDEARKCVDADWFVLANGRVVAQPAVPPFGESITIVPMSEAMLDLPLDDALNDLNTALMADGLHLVIRDGATIERPIGLLVADRCGDEPGMSQARMRIDAGAGSRATIVEYVVSSGTAEHYANAVARLDLASDAHVDYLRVQRRARHHSQTARTVIRLAERSALHYAGFDLGGTLVRNDLDVELSGRGAEVAIDGLFIAGAAQHIDNHVRVDHRVGPARSVQDFRGILGADSRCVWNGKAIVHPGADGSDARQGNHNLLLTEGSEIDAKPELEIYADDVKCSHGATIGHLDDDALFYLQTRGLDRRQAARVLTRAFGAAIVGRVPVAALAESLAEVVESRLGELTGAGDA